MEYLGQTVSFTVGEREYKISRFTRRVMRAFLDWADAYLPDPLAQIKDNLKDFPPNLQELMVKDALERKRTRKSFESPEIRSLLSTPDGVLKLLGLLLKEHQPELSEDDVEDLFNRFLAEHGEEALEKAITKTAGTVPVDESAEEREFLSERGLLPKRQAVKKK